MSAASLSAAKKRRAANSNDLNSSNPSTSSTNSFINRPSSSGGLPLQTIISTLNTRLTKLEQNTTSRNPSIDNIEIDSRFQLLVEEISEIKEMVLKLQSFTMEVNKTLFDERIKILSTDDVIDKDVNVDIDNIDDDSGITTHDLETVAENINNSLNNDN
jgi:hypothetical protein